MGGEAACRTMLRYHLPWVIPPPAFSAPAIVGLCRNARLVCRRPRAGDTQQLLLSSQRRSTSWCQQYPPKIQVAPPWACRCFRR